MYFSKVYELIGQKLHTNVKGFLLLASFVNKLNKPLSASLSKRLSALGVLPAVELEFPVINRNPSLNSFWVSGFVTGEGSLTNFTRTRKILKMKQLKI